MIQGVTIKKLKIWQDIPDVHQPLVKPGFLMEILRDDDGLLKRFGQTTFTVAYKGTIKAFHYHEKQDDLWFVASGKARVVLYDLRSTSSTYRQTDVIDTGDDNRVLIYIPVGVAHGYQVLSDEPVLLFYHTTESYNRDHPDEKRLPFDDPSIGFHWGEG